MASLDELLGELRPKVDRELADRIGIPREKASDVFGQVGSMIGAGLKKQHQSRGGDKRIDHILDKYGSPATLEDIGGTLDRQLQEERPDPDLGGLLDGNGKKASDHFSALAGHQPGHGHENYSHVGTADSRHVNEKTRQRLGKLGGGKHDRS